uniref:Uncharacterized protein n=1 Tax=Rhizophora mucronata TaxID=61149 RepID=A0A2P2MNZ0_RHIMU
MFPQDVHLDTESNFYLIRSSNWSTQEMIRIYLSTVVSLHFFPTNLLAEQVMLSRR